MSLQPFRFLDLPPEIREKIYIHVVSRPSQILLPIPGAHTTFPLSLLLTNTQIYHELRPLYFLTNSFAIILVRRNEKWDYILDPTFQDNRRQIRSLRVNIVRWGSRDFFVEQLVPVLEDMVMNGRLRELDVRVRARWDVMPDVWRQQRGNWEALLRVLRDPYLERSVLLAGPVGGSKLFPHLDMPFEVVCWKFDMEGEGVWQRAGSSSVLGKEPSENHAV